MGRKRPSKGTHFLENTEGGASQNIESQRLSDGHSLSLDRKGGTSQDTERQRTSERNPLSRERRGRNMLEHGKRVTEEGALTAWRPRREREVRTQKETE